MRHGVDSLLQSQRCFSDFHLNFPCTHRPRFVVLVGNLLSGTQLGSA